jgi:hypothetical protein
MLILVCGLPGTGKSTIANNLAKRLHATVLRTDVIRKELLEEPTYTEEEKRLIYNVTFLIARYLLEAGCNVILDGTFYRRDLRQKVYALTRETRSRLEVIECTTPVDVIKRRMGRRLTRRYEPSDADFNVYKKIKAQFEPIQREHIVVNTGKPLHKTLREISIALKKIGRESRPV